MTEENNTTHINNCSYKDVWDKIDLFGDPHDEPIHLIQWNVHTDYTNDVGGHPEWDWPENGSVSYSALCKDGIFSDLSTKTLGGSPFTPFAGHARVMIDAVHDINITGYRGPESWTNAYGLAKEFVTDDVHYSVDGNEILHEIKEPNYENGPNGREYTKKNVTDHDVFTEFCQEHPVVLDFSKDTCFNSFEELREATKKAEEHLTRVQQAQILTNDIQEKTPSNEKTEDSPAD